MGTDTWCGNAKGCTTGFKIRRSPIFPFRALGFGAVGVRKDEFGPNYVSLGVIADRRERVWGPTFRDGLKVGVGVETLVSSLKTGVTFFW